VIHELLSDHILLQTNYPLIVESLRSKANMIPQERSGKLLKFHPL
jgi:hypothetical protein